MLKVEKNFNYKFLYLPHVEHEKLTLQELINLGESKKIQIMLPGGAWISLFDYLNFIKF